MSLASIIIPAHNEEDFLAQTINSYKSQAFKMSKVEYEIIVVANACNDNTVEIADMCGADKIIELGKANVSIARNIGAENARGNILIFNDADTRVAKNYVDVIKDVMADGTDYGAAFFKPENNHPITYLYSLATWTSGFIWRDAGGNMFTKRDPFEKVGGYNPNLTLGEDTDLSRRMKDAGAKYKFLHKTHIITSMRRFEEKGYFTEFFINQMAPYVKETFLPKRRN
jgi:glycosyltransferase involved in cell wall biosynthesis